MVAIDRRGRGRSGDAAAYAIEREFEDVVAVAEWAGEQVTCWGTPRRGVRARGGPAHQRILKLVLYEPPIGFLRPRRRSSSGSRRSSRRGTGTGCSATSWRRWRVCRPTRSADALSAGVGGEARRGPHDPPRGAREPGVRLRPRSLPGASRADAAARRRRQPRAFRAAGRALQAACPTAASPSCRGSGTPRWTPAPTCSSPRPCPSSTPHGASDMTLTTPDRTHALADRLFGATRGALELFSVYLGAELGLYDALAQRAADMRRARRPRMGRATLRPGVARAAGRRRPARRRAARRPGRRAPLRARRRARPRARRARPPRPRRAVRAHARRHRRRAPQVADAYRTGGGVPYDAYGRAFRHGQGHINRPAFTHELPATGGRDARRHRRVEGAQRPRVADLGCGQGWSSSRSPAPSSRPGRRDRPRSASIADASRQPSMRASTIACASSTATPAR